jgi:hypothetical protein
MDVEKLMVVALAGGISRQQEDVIDYATAGTGLAACFATTTGMRREPMNYQRFQFSDTTGTGAMSLRTDAPTDSVKSATFIVRESGRRLGIRQRIAPLGLSGCLTMLQSCRK